MRRSRNKRSSGQKTKLSRPLFPSSGNGSHMQQPRAVVSYMMRNFTGARPQMQLCRTHVSVDSLRPAKVPGRHHPPIATTTPSLGQGHRQVLAALGALASPIMARNPIRPCETSPAVTMRPISTATMRMLDATVKMPTTRSASSIGEVLLEQTALTSHRHGRCTMMTITGGGTVVMDTTPGDTSHAATKIRDAKQISIADYHDVMISLT
jgi:hypothetical protein